MWVHAPVRTNPNARPLLVLLSCAHARMLIVRAQSWMLQVALPADSDSGLDDSDGTVLGTVMAVRDHSADCVRRRFRSADLGSAVRRKSKQSSGLRVSSSRQRRDTPYYYYY
jgi:hypothetical protein